MREIRRLGLLVAPLLVAGVGCGHETPAAPTGGTPPPSAASSASVPNPFTVVARVSTRSLGLRTPVSAEFGVAPDGDIYVADSSQRISVISPDGEVIRRWGAPGHRAGQFHFVSYDPTDPTQLNAAVTVAPDGDVYVVDSGNARVEVFSAAGAFIRELRGGANGTSFVQPEDIAVDAKRDVFVVDVNGVSKLSPNGDLMWHVGGSASTDPDLSGFLHLVDIDPHGRLVLADEDPSKVVYVDEEGHEVDSFPVADFPAGAVACGVTVNAEGDTVVESCGLRQNFLLVYDRSHSLIGGWPDCGLGNAPRFAADGEAFALASDDSAILTLRLSTRDA